MIDLDEFVRRGQRAQAAADEILVRELLGRWVSELEPAVAYDRQGRVIGLTVANAPIGSTPFVLRLSESLR